MNRKNAFSYFIWFLYSAFVCTSLSVSVISVTKEWGWGTAPGIVGAAIWLALCGLLTFCIHKVATKCINGQIGDTASKVTEIVIAVLLAAVGISIRINGISDISTDSIYFELAKVSSEHSVPTLVHGAEYSYVQLLHLIYVVFGNIYVAGIWLQIVLQVLAGIFLYLAVRRMAGVVPAMMMLGFYGLSPLMVREGLILSPSMLFLLLFSFVLYCLAGCVCGGKRSIVCMFMGVLSAIVCYLDIMGVLLVIFGLTGILWTESRREMSTKRCVISAMQYLLGVVGGFFMAIVVDALASGKAVGSILQAWWTLFAPSGISISRLPWQALRTTEVLVLLALLCFGIFSFWTKRRTEQASIWMLTLLGSLLLQGLGMTTEAMDGAVLLYIIATVLAGVGLSRIFENEAITFCSIWADGKLETQLEAMSRDVEEVLAECEVLTEEELANEEAEAVVVEEITAEEELQLAFPQVQFIENPLPLPKKHVKKVMDFDYEVKDGMEDFDIEVAADDDFDL